MSAIPLASSEDFALETAEHRFTRRQRQGLGLKMGTADDDLSADDPRAVPYSMQEGVWRPDGRGANQTIYSSFDWRGRKVRALKPVPKFKKGEQWSRPKEENNDEFIGIMMGDSRMVGNRDVSSKFSGVPVGGSVGEEGGDGQRRRYPLNYNVFSNMQVFSKGGGGGGVLTDRIYGTDEGTLREMSTREQVLGMLAQDEGNVSVGKPLPFAAMNIRNQTAGELESYVTDHRVEEFLLDPEANDDYNTLAMGATPATMGINTTGDMNTDGADNLGMDREMFVRGGPVSRGADGKVRAGAAFSTTLNPVKVSTKDLRGVNQSIAGAVTVDEFDPSDQIAPKVNTSLKSQSQTTKNLFNRNARNPDLGFTDGSMDHDKSILTSSRRTRRKEQARGQDSVTFTSADQDNRDAAILSMSRRYRRKEQARGQESVTFTSADQDNRDAAILAMSRRTRRKEQARGQESATFASADQDNRDAAILSMSRRYRRKEQARGQESVTFASADQDNRDAAILAMSRRTRRKEQARGQESVTFASADQDNRDAPILAMSRRYRRKELNRPDPLSGTGNVDGIDPLGDFHVRNAAQKKKDANRMQPLTAAILPEATLAADSTAAREQAILGEEPVQSVRSVRRQRDSSLYGFGQMSSTETEQYSMAHKVDPAAPELLSRLTQQVDLRNRTTDLAAIGVINYDETSGLKAAYSRDLAWMAPRMGKVGQKAIYESDADNGGDTSGSEM
jgi:hypothetical protein